MGSKYSLFSFLNLCITSAFEFIHQAQQFNPDTKDIYLHVHFLKMYTILYVCLFIYRKLQNGPKQAFKFVPNFANRVTEIAKSGG